jgi:hypothetical protein
MAIPQVRSFLPQPERPDCNGVTLAVYAPFGTDETLSTFPDGTSHGIEEHPILRNLQAVAATGVRVEALVDLVGANTYRIHIPAGDPSGTIIEADGKQDMIAPQTLATFVSQAQRAAPESALVLAMEGHGAGFLPDLDLRQWTLDNITGHGTIEWRLGGSPNQQMQTPYAPDGDPYLKEGAPVLPVGGPTCPTNHLAFSTYGLAEGLRHARVPRIPVIHLNNCFNMSVEVLHTIAPYAEFATGYCNYNFFTAGQAYPLVFEQLAKVGEASSEQVAKWFAAANHAVLLAAGHEPTVAGTVDLQRLHDIAEKVDDLSDALLAALRTSSAADRPAVVDKIRQAIVNAQQYDSRPDYILETPDELTDLDSFAASLLDFDFSTYKVGPAAEALREALCGIKQYGDTDSPWMDPNVTWDFSSPNLAMNIFLPDPLLNGLWDWRSQYYLDVNPDPSKPQVQPHIIDFVKVTDWVDFLIEYHRDAPFQGLLGASIPDIPLATHRCDPRCRRGGSRDDGRDGKSTFIPRD